LFVEVVHEELVLRGYQKELASDGLRGDNCLIVAPTGSGKTLVGLAIAKVSFDKLAQTVFFYRKQR
jgi:superfamily II DNA or RNA helicase